MTTPAARNTPRSFLAGLLIGLALGGLAGAEIATNWIGPLPLDPGDRAEAERIRALAHPKPDPH